jgi:transcriptional regulator with XRE-family HTH domain
MSTGRQIRAARGFLGWSRKDLAEKSGVAAVTINQIEEEKAQPREGTLSDIVRVFDENGIEFIDHSGVRIKPEGVEVLIGSKGLVQFLDDVYAHTKKYGGLIMQLGLDETMFTAITSHAPAHRDQMTELMKERKDIKIRAISCEGDTNFVSTEHRTYRWISKESFAPVPFYIYGESMAILNFQTIPAPTIVIHRFPAITLAYRKQFDAMWKLAREPETSKKSSRHKKYGTKK